MLGQKKEDRDPPDSPEAPDGGRGKSDQRILGSGGFVGAVLQKSERLLEKKYKPKRPIEKLIEVVAKRLDLKPKLICSGSRQKKIAEARALVAYLAVEETGHSAAEVARFLGISRMGVQKAVITCPPSRAQGSLRRGGRGGREFGRHEVSLER